MRIITARGDYLDIDVPEVKAWLSDLLSVQFDGHIASANRTWLRKEILRADQDKSA